MLCVRNTERRRNNFIDFFIKFREIILKICASQKMYEKNLFYQRITVLNTIDTSFKTQ